MSDYLEPLFNDDNFYLNWPILLLFGLVLFINIILLLYRLLLYKLHIYK